jgi:hypothetical protein
MISKRSLLLAIPLLAGCAVSQPSFNNRLPDSAVAAAKELAVSRKEPIAIRWVPGNFPGRVDDQAPSAFGSVTKIKVPIGRALSERITEVLDSAVGVQGSSSNVLTITVLDAKSSFHLSGSAALTSAPTMDAATCVFTVNFTYGNKEWQETFTAQGKTTTTGGQSPSGVLESAWDNIALQVGRSVVKRL